MRRMVDESLVLGLTHASRESTSDPDKRLGVNQNPDMQASKTFCPARDQEMMNGPGKHESKRRFEPNLRHRT